MAFSPVAEGLKAPAGVLLPRYAVCMRNVFVARLTLAVFVATLPGSVLWAQTLARATPTAHTTLRGAGASLAAPSPLPSMPAPAFDAAPMAALNAVPLAAAAAPVSAAVPVSAAPTPAKDATEALRGIARGIEHGGVEVVASGFDGSSRPPRASQSAASPNDHPSPLSRGAADENEAGSENDGRIDRAVHAPAPQEETPGLTQDLLDKVVGTLQLIDRKFVEKLSPEKWAELIDKGLAAITAALNEPHTEYFDRDAWAKILQTIDGHMSGIGVLPDTTLETKAFKEALDAAKAEAGTLDGAAEDKLAEKIPFNVHKDGLRVMRIRPGSPAEAAGVQLGDVIVRVDGREVSGRPFEDALKMITGRPGTDVKLTVLRGGANVELTATRAEMEVPLLTARMAAPGIGYLYYGEFRSRSEKDFIDALYGLQAKGAKKIIIDLRGNPGGDLHAANGILASLLPEGLNTISTERRDGYGSTARTDRAGPFAGMEKLVLIDGRSASGSDLTAATLQDYGAVVVGPGNSYGKFSVQTVLGLPSDTGIKITTGRTYSGKGRSLPGRPDPRTGENVPGSGGVTPDVIVPMTKEEELAVHKAIKERLWGEDPKHVADPVLDKAIQILRARPAGSSS